MLEFDIIKKANNKSTNNEAFSFEIVKASTARQKRQQSDIQKQDLLSAAYVDNGKLRIDKNQVAQSKGFSSNAELEAFKANKPELYKAMGGVNYLPQSAPVTDTNKISLSNEAVNKIVNRFSNTDTKEIDGIIKTLGSGEWLDAGTMKKYSDAVNTYANDYIALNELGYFDSVPEEERTSNIELLRALKEAVKSIKDEFADYKDADSYKEAIRAREDYQKMLSTDTVALQGEIDTLEGYYVKVKELHDKVKVYTRQKNNWERRSNGLKTDGGYGVKLNAVKSELDALLSKLGYSSFDALETDLIDKKSYKEKAVAEQENEAQITDLTKNAQTAVDFKEISSYKVCNSEKELLNKYNTEDFDSNNLDLLVDYLCTDSKAVRDSITNHRYIAYLEM